MAITALPDPPSRSDPSTFAAKGDALLGALPTFVTEANALQTDVNAKQVTATSAASTATTQAGIATTQATTATTQAGIATTKAAEAAASLSGSLAVNSNYLSPKASDPSVNDQGGALTTGMLYYNTATGTTRVYGGSSWKDAGSAVNGTANRYSYVATTSQTTFTAVYDIGFVDVYLNGIKLAPTDFTATSGTNVVLSIGAALNDTVDIIGYGAFEVANTYTQAQTDALLAPITAQLATKADTSSVYSLAQIQAAALCF